MANFHYDRQISIKHNFKLVHMDDVYLIFLQLTLYIIEKK